MSLIRVIILSTLFLIFAALPSQSTQALVLSAETQFSCATVTEIPQIECGALVALYNETDGPNWQDTTGWLATNTPCSWYGVTCDGGHVTRLKLFGTSPSDRFGLQGDLLTEIGNLSQIIELSLSFNQLSSLPTEINNLTSLVTLSLQRNLTDSPA